MAVHHRLHPADRTVRIRIEGDPAFEDWDDLLAALAADPAFRSGFRILLDLTGAPPPGAACVRRSVTVLRAYGPRFAGCRWAVVVEDQASYGMVRMAQGLAGDDLPDMTIVRTADDGEAWLAGDTQERLG